MQVGVEEEGEVGVGRQTGEEKLVGDEVVE